MWCPLGLQSLLQTEEWKQFQWVVKKSRLLQKVQPGMKFRILTGIWGTWKEIQSTGGRRVGIRHDCHSSQDKGKEQATLAAGAEVKTVTVIP